MNMKKFKKIAAIGCAAMMVVSSMSMSVFAMSGINVDIDKNERINLKIDSLTENIISSFNDSDYEKLLEYTDGSMKTDLYDLFLGKNSADYKKNDIGFWSIDNMKLMRYKIVPNEEVPAGCVNYDDYDMYANVITAYVGINISANHDSADVFSGPNYFIWVMGKNNINDDYKLLQWSQPSMLEIENTNIVYGDGDEQLQKDIQIARNRGLILDGNKNVIENRRNISGDVSVLASNKPSDCPIPSTIRVKLASKNTISVVNFYNYVKDVLPNEWTASADPLESLKTGAMCVKMYGWYRCYNYKYYGKGFDVMDTTADQVYVAGSEHSRTNTAINAVGGIGLMNTAGLIFETQYLANATTANGGKVGQIKSNSLANSGYNWHQICNYFYSYSDKSTGDTAQFRYY